MKSIFHNYRCSKLEIILLLSSVLVLLWAILSQVKGTGWSIWFETNGLAHIGSFMGGIFAILSIYYLIKNLAEQRQITAIQSFESNYLEIVKFCRDQVSQASIPDSDSSTGNHQQLHGREIFSLFSLQVEKAVDDIRMSLQNKEFAEIFVTSQEFERQRLIWGEKLQDRTVASIAYIITYVGVRKRDIDLLRNKYLSQYKQEYVNEVIAIFRQKLAQYAPENLRNGSSGRLHQTEILNCNDKTYHGFQDEVGNYFRMLYQAVTFVDSQSNLSYSEKYKYVKMLRGQMSNMEEVILFYNSLCDLGLSWEYNGSDQN
ncbi:MAG: putative phage abortive infection protein, partial [Allobaculum sp.]|nr:putative phage abortive infection protein [Allobaculum sp.]